MNAVTFHAIREGLGFTRETIADRLGVREKTVRDWELGKLVVAEGVAEEMLIMVDDFADEISDLAEQQDPMVRVSDRETRARAFATLVLNPDTRVDSV